VRWPAGGDDRRLGRLRRPGGADLLDRRTAGRWRRRTGGRRVDLRSDRAADPQENPPKPRQERSWCIPELSGEFGARREDLLELDAEPPDEARPVVCRDELSQEGHGEGAEPIAPEPGHPAQEDSEYTRDATAAVFRRLGPLSGRRHLEVTPRRGSRGFARLMKAVVDDDFAKAEVIRVVVDDLNPHVLGALYETSSPEEARRIAQRRELHYTPKPGSRLNRAESEFSVLSRPCLGRRIETAEDLRAEIAAWERARHEARAPIDGCFRVADARKKLHWVYPS
jgi:DDE superfamily endonuclease